MHSQAYRHQEGHENKNVLVVGIGNSALDVAIEMCRFSKQVFIITVDTHTHISISYTCPPIVVHGYGIVSV
jgi:cation diffusion facilitator CzcD-associated flavoprotein CzcO